MDSPASHLPERIDTDQPEWQQRYVDARKVSEACGHVLEGGTPARLQGNGDGIVEVLRVEDTIQNQPHVPNTKLVQLAARALGLRERRRIGTRDQDEGRLFLIAQRRVRGRIE